MLRKMAPIAFGASSLHRGPTYPKAACPFACRYSAARRSNLDNLGFGKPRSRAPLSAVVTAPFPKGISRVVATRPKE